MAPMEGFKVDSNSQVQESLEALAYVGGPAYASEWSQRPTRDEPYVIENQCQLQLLPACSRREHALSDASG
jgi:hypothetical protein